MTIYNYLQNLYVQYRASPDTVKSYMRNMFSYIRGFEYAERWPPESNRSDCDDKTQNDACNQLFNPLLDYFKSNNTGAGIWKWEHYFEIYQRHFRGFVNRPMIILEIGIYSGGSLNMWRSYFGKQCHVFGVDIEPACKSYESEGVTIMIGDQKNREFWKTFKDNVAYVDVLIDDGGHKSEQQIVTLEEMLPHIRPGGVYLCEDIHGIHRELISFACGLVNELNRYNIHGVPSSFQKCVHSIHLYPYLLVIEKHKNAPVKFHASKHGTEWQPFYDQRAELSLEC